MASKDDALGRLGEADDLARVLAGQESLGHDDKEADDCRTRKGMRYHKR